jgi:ferritin-like protein
VTTETLTLADLDPDGILGSVAEPVLPPQTRTRLLRAAIGGAAAIVTGLAAAAPGRAASGLSANDVGMLRFDLVLEYLQAGLYTEAERLGQLTPKTLAWSRVVGAHERAHAAAIRGILGKKAVPSPAFDYRGVTTHEGDFIRTAVAFEELTAALLKWQAARLDSRPVIAAVATLHSVETRHAAWIRRIVGLRPAAHAFDDPAPQARMARLIASTHFVVADKPKMSRHAKPPFTG